MQEKNALMEGLTHFFKSTKGNLYISNLHKKSNFNEPQYCLTLSKDELQYARLFGGDRNQIRFNFNTMTLSVDGIVQKNNMLKAFKKEVESILKDINNQSAKIYLPVQKQGQNQ